MTTIKELAQRYVPQETKNVADLPEISVDENIETKVVNQGKEDEFSYEYMTKDGIEYRVPKTVIKQIKRILEVSQNVKFVKVVKKGSGLATEYNVVPVA